MKREELISMINTLPPSSILGLLPRLGYKKGEEIEGRGFLFSAPDGEEIAVVANQRFRDYGRATLTMLESLVEPDLSLDDLVGMLVLPDSDIYRHKFDDDLARWGSLPMKSFTELVPALLDLLTYTAAGVYSQRRSYTKLPAPATEFEHGCRVGQTEHSSYVLKVYCPTNATASDSTAVSPAVEEEPFGRLVTKACLDNLAFLSREEADYTDADAPPTLNRNVAKAISRLRPMSFITRGAASVWFSAKGKERPENSQVLFDDKTFTRAYQWELQLGSGEGIEREAFRGYIVDLHKDRPRRSTQISHSVTVDVTYGGGRKFIHLDLLPSQYRQAVRWHDRNQQVRVDALFNKRKRVWTATELIEFESMDANQVEMFEEPEEVLRGPEVLPDAAALTPPATTVPGPGDHR